MPNSYVEIERDEMEYVDGGSGVSVLVNIVATAVTGITGVYTSSSMVYAALGYLGGAVETTFYSIATWAAFNPALAGAVAATIVAAIAGVIVAKYV
jgi:hypothetical protein